MKIGEWTATGTAIARQCGHAYDIQEAINDQGAHVTRHDAYPNPDDPSSEYDACDFCHDCYVAAMDRRLAKSPIDVTKAFSARAVLNV
jgi:hypothetical protein